jgi:spore protease
MQIRTDLALEQKEMHQNLPDGVNLEEYESSGVTITRILIENDAGAKALSKPEGCYITAQVPSFSDNSQKEETIWAVAREFKKLLPKEGAALVVGLGNHNITPDALGPLACGRVLATRHIEKELARAAGMEYARSVAVIVPGVLGQTGVEAFDIIKGVAEKVKPSVIITVDALASRKLERLGKTVQMSNTGIEPGAGVGNARYEISQKTLGVPVIAVGVPTVVDAATLIYDLTDGNCTMKDQDQRQMIVTPKEIDLLVERAAHFIADVINFSLQENTDPKIIKEILR